MFYLIWGEIAKLKNLAILLVKESNLAIFPEKKGVFPLF